MNWTRVLAAAALTAAAVLGADFNGKWKAAVPGRGGATREVTFTFKVEGEKATGTMSDNRGSNDLSEVQIAGDKVTFGVETRGGRRTYTGTLAGDEIRFKREGGAQGGQEFVAKRVP